MRAADGITRRIVSLFSCGAASAVATWLVLQESHGLPVVILNNGIREEHSDNARFMADCERWFGQSVLSTYVEKYDGSIINVFMREKFIRMKTGAICTRVLKREARKDFMQFGDQLILGFTKEEQDRLDKFIDANQDMDARAPLISYGLSKADCLGMLQKVGIELPAMYKLGYNNNNCIGCVKGGKGYWNKIRVDFPDAFERMAKVQDLLGPGSYFWPGKKTGDVRISLRELPPDAGNYPDEPGIECGAVCEMLDPNGEAIKGL